MKATEQDKRFYWLMRDAIREHYASEGVELTKEGLHEYLKHYAQLRVSMEEITKDELAKLKECTKFYALNRLGIDFDEDDGTQFSEDFYHS